MQKIMHTQRGLSLIEALIAVALFVLLMLAVVKLYTTYNTLFGVQRSRVDVTLSASHIIGEVHAAALQADAILSFYTFSGTTYTTGTSTLVLELPSITSSGDIISGVHDHIAFYTQGTNVYEVVDAGAGSVRVAGVKRLSAVVGTLAFTYNNTNVTQATSTTVDVLSQSIVKGQTVQSDVQEKTYLRNI